jgi:hypothetical protein
MKKFLSIAGLCFFLFDFIESLTYDLMPVLASAETIAYKAGFVVAISLTLVAVLGCDYWIYEFFTASQPSSQPA